MSLGALAATRPAAEALRLIRRSKATPMVTSILESSLKKSGPLVQKATADQGLPGLAAIADSRRMSLSARSILTPDETN